MKNIAVSNSESMKLQNEVLGLVFVSAIFQIFVMERNSFHKVLLTYWLPMFCKLSYLFLKMTIIYTVIWAGSAAKFPLYMFFL